MLALDLLGIPFARAVHVSVQMPGVRPPMIGIKAREPEGLQQRFELQKDFILATPKDVRQDGTRVVIDGMPQPALVAFFANKAPHLVYLCLASTLNVYGNLLWLQGAEQGGIDRLKRCFFFLEFTEHGVSTDPEH